MAWTYTFDTDTPVGTDAPSVIDDRIRELKDALQERLAVEHVFAKTDSEVSGANTGKHSDITATSLTSAGAISGTTIGGTDITASGAVAGATAAITGNATVGGTLGVTGVATVAKGSLLASSDAPTTDAMIANKKYVDDLAIASVATSPEAKAVTLSTSWQSVTLADVTVKSIVTVVVKPVSVSSIIAVRPKSDTAIVSSLDSNTVGANIGFVSATRSPILVTTTDASGNIDILSQNTGTVTVTVLSHIPISTG